MYYCATIITDLIRGFLKHELHRIHSWITLLTEDEAFIIKRHYFDGIDLPRIVLEFNTRWGPEYGRDERTLKRYQARALKRIAQFEIATRNHFE